MLLGVVSLRVAEGAAVVGVGEPRFLKARQGVHLGRRKGEEGVSEEWQEIVMDDNYAYLFN